MKPKTVLFAFSKPVQFNRSRFSNSGGLFDRLASSKSVSKEVLQDIHY